MLLVARASRIIFVDMHWGLRFPSPGLVRSWILHTLASSQICDLACQSKQNHGFRSHCQFPKSMIRLSGKQNNGFLLTLEIFRIFDVACQGKENDRLYLPGQALESTVVIARANEINECVLICFSQIFDFACQCKQNH